MGVELIKPVLPINQSNSSQLNEHEGLNLSKHQEAPVVPEESEEKKTATPPINQAEVSKNVKLANEFLKTLETRLEYHYDEKINREVVKVVNQDNGEVVRQLPAEEIVKMLTKMHELLGVFFDRKF